jgi:predicted transposase/invertase (TIGR01784 family)
MGYAKSMLLSSRDAGFVKGREEGKKNAKLDIARNAKAMGMAVEDIAKLTGLSMDEVARV